MCFFDDWIDGNSISRDPRIYIDGWSYPSRKHLQNMFSKFTTLKVYQNRFGNQLDSESRMSRLSRQGESAKPTFVGWLSPRGLVLGQVAHG